MKTARDTWSDVMDSHSGVALQWGPTDVDRYLMDPKRIAFFMARYKFAARMLHDCATIVDVGCGSGMGTLTFLTDTNATRVQGIDFEPKVIDHAVDHLLPALRRVRPDDVERLTFTRRDFMDGFYAASVCDGMACLDVIEHVRPNDAPEFIARMAGWLDDGIAIVGTPNVAAAKYGSAHSRIGHINLYDADRLHSELKRAFRHVMMFGMNDEVIHCGFLPMAHYLMAVCVK